MSEEKQHSEHEVRLNENGEICIIDGPLAWNFTSQAILDNFKENRSLTEKVRELDYLANRADPDRFVPALISELETRAASAGAPRDESYAMAILLIRRFIGPDKK